MTKGIKRLIRIARRNVSKEIVANRGDGSSAIARADAGSGYYGGYRAALDDVILALNGNIPNRNGWWELGEVNSVERKD